ncbi:MAG TPA: rhodanese-like domain-containing protein [Acidimicrobiales bacterium]|nr:rhodanese-like domain-containing protein [Acidimicrobiales bacterium]
MTKSAQDLVTEAKAQVENLTVDQVAAELEGSDVQVVDIRESEEVAATGRIPGAVHIPRGLLEFKTDAIDPSKRVILHCAVGGRSALAAVTLKEMGYGNVAHLDGGMTAWLQAGRPVEKD